MSIVMQEARDVRKMDGRCKSLLDALAKKRVMSLTMEVCSLCNLKCKFCDMHSGRIKNVEKQKGIMSFGLYKKIINSIAKVGYKLKALHFQGNGEPLIHKDFVKMVKYAKSKKVSEKLVLATNGVLLSKDMTDRIMSSGIDEIHVSLDVVGQAKYKEVKGKDNFLSVMSNIGYVADKVCSRDNVKLYIKVAIPTKEGDYGIDRDDFNKAINELESMTGKNVFVKTMPIALQQDGVRLKRAANNVPCELVFYMVYIKFDGRASACCADIFDELYIGKMPDQSFKDITTSDKLKRIRLAHINKQLGEFPLCLYCENRYADLDKYRKEITKLL